ncbi:MAG: deoxyribodipyrimidine photo-lyase [bacterium]|nr:deoxyribodipyrimidine photo-lyase [bacterium]
MMLDFLEYRIKKLNNKEININKKFIIYVMEASQREDYNHALEFSIYQSNILKKPLLVIFFVTDKFKYSNIRYYKFMLEGIVKTKYEIESRGVKFLIVKDTFVNGTLNLSKDAALIVFDKNYLRTQRIWRKKVSELLDCASFEIESDVVVPVELISNNLIPYAYIYRQKLEKIRDIFLKKVPKLEPKIKSIDIKIPNYQNAFELPSLNNNFNILVSYILNELNIDKSLSTVEKYYIGGSDEAYKKLNDFINNKLFRYKEFRSHPDKDYTSNLSPYLHFGQISPIKIVMEILKYYEINDDNVKSFFNELIIWRELARNYVLFNEFYNQYEGLPLWAKNTLYEHINDKREYIYDLKDLEEANTHDIYWNAAQKEMLLTGKMHNYMRMYWAKKIIEWSKSPKQAFDIACYLNDKYLLDGRDANGYAGISWCFGAFDRPFKERNIFGKIRYMSDKALKNKFDIQKYLDKYL